MLNFKFFLFIYFFKYFSKKKFIFLNTKKCKRLLCIIGFGEEEEEKKTRNEHY
jgi:hypothetical protein